MNSLYTQIKSNKNVIELSNDWLFLDGFMPVICHPKFGYHILPVYNRTIVANLYKTNQKTEAAIKFAQSRENV